MNKLIRKILLGASIFFIALCPLIFLAGAFAPRMLGFLDSVLCPDGMQITNYNYKTIAKTNTGVDSYSEADAVNLICADGKGNTVDITPQMLGIVFSLPVISGLFWYFSVREGKPA